MSWFTENPWPLVVLLSALAVVAVMTLERRGGLVGAGLLAAAFAVWWVEDVIVTPAETVELELQAILEAFKSGNDGLVHAQISDDAPKLKEIATRGIEMVRLHSGFHLKDIRITIEPDGNTAVAHLRANGRATLRTGSLEQQVATRWTTTWSRSGDRWLLSDVRRLDLVSGDEIGILDYR